jgi:hypothetical protein
MQPVSGSNDQLIKADCFGKKKDKEPKRIISFYDGSFSAFFYACEWRSYVFYVSYRKAFEIIYFVNDSIYCLT